MKNNNWKLLVLSVAILALAAPMALNAKPPAQPVSLAEQVRHELVMLPWYGVFDNLAFTVNDGRVTLMGHVTRPTLKSDAEAVVKHLPGVAAVENRIEVLPLSSFDDRIRIGVARSVYGYSALNRYGMGAQPSIRIIVNNGVVTLEGVVDNDTDRNIAAIRANGVFGVFEVKNNLKVATRHS